MLNYKIRDIEKLFEVYDCIVELEKKLGTPIKTEFILNKVVNSKNLRIRINKREAKNILEKLSIYGVIFTPRKDYTARFVSWTSKDIEKNNKGVKKLK